MNPDVLWEERRGGGGLCIALKEIDKIYESFFFLRNDCGCGDCAVE